MRFLAWVLGCGRRRIAYRQGDVLLIAEADVPTDARPVDRERGRIVLARGEATGHAHAIPGIEVDAFTRDGNLYLRVRGPASLQHEEHAPIELPVGDYEVRRQREYVPPRPEEDPVPSVREVED